MNRYRGNQALTLTFTLANDDGSAILDASAVRYAVYDQSAQELLAATLVPDFVAGSASITLALPVALNTLAGVNPELRAVHLTITTPAGTVYQRETYLLDPAERLTPLVNSLLTEGEAELIASELLEMDAYWGVSRNDRIAALKVAYERVCKPTFTITHSWLQQVYGFDFDWQRYDWWDYYSPWWYWHYRDWIIPHLGKLDAGHWAKLPVQFQDAVKKAQVAEANDLLRGDTIEKKRVDGLMSESVGESSNMYRPGKPAIFPVCRDAMNHLRPFVKFQVRTSRS